MKVTVRTSVSDPDSVRFVDPSPGRQNTHRKKSRNLISFYIVCYSLADPDKGSVAFWILGSGMEKIRIRNEHPR
jgi:hypothetical protein